MRIVIETIPHDQQRYPTVGDWILEGEDLTIRVSEMGNWRYNAAVAVHELVEVLLCKDKCISQESVDAFDMAFETDRTNFGIDMGEPGDSPSAPYRDQHSFATAVERMLIAAFGLSWAEYDATVNAL